MGLKHNRIVERFKIRITAIAAEIGTQFDDIVALSNCSEAEDLIATRYQQAAELKNQLRKQIDDNLPIRVIIENLRNRAEEVKGNLGELGKRR